MLIQCTKKLLSELKIKPAATISEEEPLFSWHANLILVNRRKTLVLMNDRSRYIIVMYGLRAKDFKNIDRLIFQAIRETFWEEGLKEEIIEAYISKAKNLTYTTTKNKTFVARLNKACDNVHFYTREINQHLIIQPSISKQSSRLIVGTGSNDYTRPNEDLYNDLEKLFKGPVFQSEAFVLHVHLNLQNHTIWRRVVVPKHITFPNLHKTLQIVFGWQDYHLHEFNIYKPGSFDRMGTVLHDHPIITLVCHEEAFSYDYGVPMKIETTEKLLDYLPAQIIYKYDFGEDWNHHIVVEEAIGDYDKNYPSCLAGEGNTPPEDVGGEPGFEHFLEIMADPTHSDYRHMREWGIRQGYKDFDIEMVNRRLKYV
jgi:hypothetical protein